MRRSRKGRIAGGALFGLGTAAAAAAAGAFGSRRAPEVYPRLDRPGWAPPASVFGPVWGVLYTAIAAAGWRLWRARAGAPALGLHVAQLVLNGAWPSVFFVARDQRAALGVIAALDAATAAEIALVARRDPLSAALLAPYLGWSVYATALTARIDPASEATASSVR